MPVRKPKRPLKRLNAEVVASEESEEGKKLWTRRNWTEARELYVTSQPQLNLMQVAKRTGIPYNQVRNRSSKERWVTLRAQEQSRILKARRQEFLQKMAGQAITFDETSIDIAKLGQGLIAGRLVEISKFMAAAGLRTDITVAKLQAHEPLEKGDLYSMVNYKELASLAQAALMFQEIGRKAFGQEIVDGSLLKEAEGDSDDIEKVVTIGGELSKDDPQRLAAFLEALERTGITAIDLQPVEDADDMDTEQAQVIEGEVLPPVPQIEAKKEEEEQ